MRFKRASASCSDAKSLVCSVVLLALLSVGAPAHAKVFHSRQEALKLAFPTADRVEKDTHILSAKEIAEIEAVSRAPVESKLVTIFTAYRSDALLGYAHIDIHPVRTQDEAFLVVLTPTGEVRSARVLAFHEPLDYLPAERWYAQFVGKTREDRLRVHGDVHGVVGATLSTRVATAAVRRVLAYHAVLLVGGGE